MARIDHSLCTHPRTPAGRAVCRRQTEEFNVAVGREPDGSAKPARNAKAVAARTARTLAGELPTPTAESLPDVLMPPKSTRKVRVRVTRRNANDPYAWCVQAELHVGGGRCACGWSAVDTTSR